MGGGGVGGEIGGDGQKWHLIEKLHVLATVIEGNVNRHPQTGKEEQFLAFCVSEISLQQKLLPLIETEFKV